MPPISPPRPCQSWAQHRHALRRTVRERRETERERERERNRSREERERKREGKTDRENRSRGGGDIVATNITAATVPTPRVTSW